MSGSDELGGQGPQEPGSAPHTNYGGISQTDSTLPRNLYAQGVFLTIFLYIRFIKGKKKAAISQIPYFPTKKSDRSLVGIRLFMALWVSVVGAACVDIIGLDES